MGTFSDNRVAMGLAVGLDYKNPKLDIHAMMQVWHRATHLYLSF